MTSRRPNLRRLLRYSPIPVALTITATLFSGNTITLFNDWDWFNQTFHTQPHNEELPQPDPSPWPPSLPATNIQVNPVITVDPVITIAPADVTVTWQQSSPGNDIDLHLDHHSAPSMVIDAPAPIEMTLPDLGINVDTDVRQWGPPQSRIDAPDRGNVQTFRWHSWRMFTTTADPGPYEVWSPAFNPANSVTTPGLLPLFDEDAVLAAIALNSPALLQNYGLSTNGLPLLTPDSPALMAITEPQVLLGLGLVGMAIALGQPRFSD